MLMDVDNMIIAFTSIDLLKFMIICYAIFQTLTRSVICKSSLFHISIYHHAYAFLSILITEGVRQKMLHVMSILDFL